MSAQGNPDLSGKRLDLGSCQEVFGAQSPYMISLWLPGRRIHTSPIHARIKVAREAGKSYFRPLRAHGGEFFVFCLARLGDVCPELKKEFAKFELREPPSRRS